MTSDSASQPASDLSALLDSWERQQEVYIPAREVRYRLMLDLIAASRGSEGASLRVLDLACGPGSGSRRVRERWPEAEIVAIDIDPVLLAMGQQSWPEGLAPITWVDADLTSETWPALAGATGSFDVVISTTALHWLAPDQLARVYHHAAELLRPGGLLLNGDYAPPAQDAAPVRELIGLVQAARQADAVNAGAQTWEGWWSAVEGSALFPAEAAERARRFASLERRDEPSRAVHVEALTRAGFAAQVVWEDADEVLFVAVKEDRR